jgi:small subunit ribosomal protein S4
MTKRIQSKYKIDRRLGVNLWGRPNSPINKRTSRPGQHGARRPRPTDFGTQLMAKQKLKGYYGNITEKVFRNVYKEAANLRGDTAEMLVGLLERRLDIIVYRMKFVATVFAARQFVSHGHVMVNGKRVNIASYRVSPGDVIEVKAASQKLSFVTEALALGERDTPEYYNMEASGLKGTYIRVPSFDEIPYPVQMEPNLVIEFYSR